MDETAFQLDAFQTDAFQIETSTTSEEVVSGWESQIGMWRKGPQNSKRTGKRYRIYNT